MVDKKEIRRAGLFKRKFLWGLPDGFSIGRAASWGERAECLELIRSQYDKRGYIQPGSLRDRVWEAPFVSATFYISDGERIVGTSGVIQDSGLRLPADINFPDELRAIREKGKVCEFTNQAFLPGYRDTGLIFELMRYQFVYAYYKKNKFIAAQVSPEHEKFYEMNLFNKKGNERADSKNPQDRIVLEVLDTKGLRRRTLEKDLELGESAFLYDRWFNKNPYGSMWEFFSGDLLAREPVHRPMSQEWVEEVKRRGICNFSE